MTFGHPPSCDAYLDAIRGYEKSYFWPTVQAISVALGIPLEEFADPSFKERTPNAEPARRLGRPSKTTASPISKRVLGAWVVA